MQSLLCVPFVVEPKSYNKPFVLLHYVSLYSARLKKGLCGKSSEDVHRPHNLSW